MAAVFFRRCRTGSLLCFELDNWDRSHLQRSLSSPRFRIKRKRDLLWSYDLGKPYDPRTGISLPADVPMGHGDIAIRIDSSVPALCGFLAACLPWGLGGRSRPQTLRLPCIENSPANSPAPMTLMEVTVPSLDLRSMSLFLATAGGKNPDVLDGFELWPSGTAPVHRAVHDRRLRLSHGLQRSTDS